MHAPSHSLYTADHRILIIVVGVQGTRRELVVETARRSLSMSVGVGGISAFAVERSNLLTSVAAAVCHRRR